MPCNFWNVHITNLYRRCHTKTRLVGPHLPTLLLIWKQQGSQKTCFCGIFLTSWWIVCHRQHLNRWTSFPDKLMGCPPFKPATFSLHEMNGEIFSRLKQWVDFFYLLASFLVKGENPVTDWVKYGKYGPHYSFREEIWLCFFILHTTKLICSAPEWGHDGGAKHTCVT